MNTVRRTLTVAGPLALVLSLGGCDPERGHPCGGNPAQLRTVKALVRAR